MGFSLNEILLSRSYIAATGRVVGYLENVEIDEGKSTSYYSPVVEFTDPRTGYQYTSSSRMYSNPPEFGIGQQAPILFNPDNPDDYIIINTFKERYIFAIPGTLLFIIGIIFLISIITHSSGGLVRILRARWSKWLWN